MDRFISRKDLEIRHSQSYAMRGRLKQLGCEWDPVARAWIAPSLEVRELCYEELEAKKAESDEIRSPYFGPASWSEELNQFAEKLIAGEDTAHGALPEEARPISHIPTQEEVTKIVGEGNVDRYWREDLPEVAAEILASGENNQAAIYERLQEQGWKSRSISLLLDVVSHFRTYHP